MSIKSIFFKKVFFRFLANFFTPIPGIVNLKAWNRKIYFLNKAGYKIEKDCFIGESFFCIRGNEEYVSIQDNTTIGVFAKLFIFNCISIGKFCMFAQDITFINGGHDKDSYEPHSAKITIGNGVWIGSGVKVIAKKDLQIGNNVLVGGGSLVMDDIPDNAIVAGIPAKIIGYRTLPEKVWHVRGYYCPKKFIFLEKFI